MRQLLQPVEAAHCCNLEALTWYLHAAKQNHTQAMLQLGALLHDGDRQSACHGILRYFLAVGIIFEGSQVVVSLMTLGYFGGPQMSLEVSPAPA